MRFRFAPPLGAIALVLVSSPAFAVATALDIVDRWNPAVNTDEMNVYEIYNHLYGTGFTSSAQLSGLEQLPDQVFDFGSDSITLDAAARYAGSRQRFGFYQPPGTGLPGATLTELFFVTQSGLVNMPTQTVNPTGPFGFYLDPVGGRADPFLWYSEEILNNGVDQMILFQTPDPNVYLMLWSDLRADGTHDLDFNDLVVELIVNRNVIPEPASLALLGLGVATMGLWRFKSKLF